MKGTPAVVGRVVFSEGRKRFVPKLTEQLQRVMDTFAVNDTVHLTFTTKKPTRSQSQLSYYWVILGYLAEYVGCRPEEMHEIVMRRKFGTKRVMVDGVEEEVRRSISDAGKMPKCESACKKDPLFGVIGIQTGPR